MRNYKNSTVWQQSHDLTLKIYKVTRDFSKTEIYGLTSQIRRASVSIGSNIVEGSLRSSEKEFSRFLEITLSSAGEVEYQLLVAKDLEYIQIDSFEVLSEKVGAIKKQLYQLIKKLN